MARHATRGLTERELQIMHVVWDAGPCSAGSIRDRLAEQGLDLAATTVATLVKVLCEKGHLAPDDSTRPKTFRATRPREEVVGSMLGDMLDRVFRGSREEMLLHLFRRDKLTRAERARIERLLDELES